MVGLGDMRAVPHIHYVLPKPPHRARGSVRQFLGFADNLDQARTARLPGHEAVSNTGKWIAVRAEYVLHAVLGDGCIWCGRKKPSFIVETDQQIATGTRLRIHQTEYVSRKFRALGR